MMYRKSCFDTSIPSRNIWDKTSRHRSYLEAVQSVRNRGNRSRTQRHMRVENMSEILS
jgi:hypothetical protein